MCKERIKGLGGFLKNINIWEVNRCRIVNKRGELGESNVM